MKKYSIVLLISLFVSGCAPQYITLTPSIWGKVVDADTKEPVPNAIVFFAGDAYSPEVLTDERGNFRLHKTTKFVAPMFAGTIHSSPIGILVINKEGYEPLEIRVNRENPGDGLRELRKKKQTTSK